MCVVVQLMLKKKSLFGIAVGTALVLALVLSGDSAWSAAGQWRLEAEIDVFLAIESDKVGWNIDDLLSHSDVSLSDEYSSVVDRLGETELEHLGLESSLHKVLNLQTENVIELHVLLIENTDSHQSSEEGVTFEQSLWVLVLEGEQVSGGLSDLGQEKLGPPDLFLVLEANLADELQLGVESFLLVRSLWGDIRLVVVLHFYGRHGFTL